MKEIEVICSMINNEIYELAERIMDESDLTLGDLREIGDIQDYIEEVISDYIKTEFNREQSSILLSSFEEHKETFFRTYIPIFTEILRDLIEED